MPFTLNLTFGGLCLFVPDSESGQLEMCALLPTCRHSPHLPRLVFDTASRTGSAPTKFPELLPLENSQIDLTSLQAAPPAQPPPAEVLNLTTVFAHYQQDVRVPRGLLSDPSPGGAVNTRFRFKAGTPAVTPCGVGGFWLFPTPDPPSIQLPIQVVWTMMIDSPSLKLEIKGINGSTASTPLELFPDPTPNVLDLWVLNSPSGQLPAKFPPPNSTDVPDPLDPATHVACFYPLTGTPGLAVPLFDEDVAVPANCSGGPGDPGLDAMCIAAVAMPKP